MSDLRTYIDGNSVGHAAMHGQGKNGKKLYAGERETTAIYGMVRSMQVILRERSHAMPVVLWDGRSWRYNRHEDYKGTRTDTVEKLKEREGYRAQRRDMFRALHLLGVRQVIAGNMEADDLAGFLVRQAVTSGKHVSLITGDKDWLQLVQDRVVWVDHKIDRKCSHRNFHEFTGFKNPKAFVHSKALQGDNGDNVPGCGGIGAKGALDLLSVYDCVHTLQAMSQDAANDLWVAAGNKLVGGKLPKKFQALRDDADTRARFEFGLEMMDLNHPNIPKPENVRATHSALDRDGFIAFCQEFAFASILKDLDRFLIPFNNLQKEYGN